MFNYTQVTMTLVNFTTLQQYLPKKLYKTYTLTRDHGNIYIANLEQLYFSANFTNHSPHKSVENHTFIAQLT